MTTPTRDEIDHDALLARADSLPPTDGIGADCLITQMALAIRALRDQREETIAKLADPAAVVANMMRGHIAKPDFRAFLSIYGEVFNDLEAANIANIELRDQREADALPAGWVLCTADASLQSSDPRRQLSVLLIRDPAGKAKWHELSEEEREATPLYWAGVGMTINEAIRNARSAMSAQGEG